MRPSVIGIRNILSVVLAVVMGVGHNEDVNHWIQNI